MDSKLFRLSLRNFLNGLVVAVGSAIILTIQAWITNPDFSIFALTTADLIVIGNVALVAGLGYISKKFFSTEDGKVGGVL